MDKRTSKKKCTCFYCGKEYVNTNFYKSDSIFYKGLGKIPYCKQDVEQFYQYFFDKYTNEGCLVPERKAVKRVCMALDIYYKEDVFNSCMNKIKESSINISPMGQYMKTIQLSQYKNKTYENTISDEEKEDFSSSAVKDISDSRTTDERTIQFFGSGFSDEDYEYLKREYDDWTARHECNTKSQEEVFKRLCFTSLELLKASRRGEDTKNLNDTYLKQLDAAKLQPKQNKGDTTAETQTFGTLIDKWETTRPLPEIDEELKDVDKLGFLIHVFYTGHMAKVLGFKSTLTNLYDKYIKKYSVEKKEYNNESDEEVLFDKIFGKNMDE